MPTLDANQVYNILQNLRYLEISYMEYSHHPIDFSQYQTYLDYFNNYALKSQNLYRFYFPLSIDKQRLPRYISEIGDVTDTLNIASGYDFSASKIFNFPAALRHRCNYYSLIYQMEGTSDLSLDNETFTLNRGDFYLLSPNVYYSIQTSLDGLSLCLNLRRSFIAAEYKSIALGNPQLTTFLTDSLTPDNTSYYVAIHTGGDHSIDEFVLKIFAEYINQDEYSMISMRSYLALLFAYILRTPTTKMESSAKITRLDEQFHIIETYLNKHYSTANLTDISNEIHFSKQYICRIVKEKTGETFNNLLIQIRLEMVEQYLLDTDLPLEEIAFLCGFSAASHMSRTFKNKNGITPSAYRSKNKTLLP
ncbi:MAG: AraC family transcriptional regulator [Lachnospiraceae bacterium]|nr:AraC family transcriptional regulator [Lachnospiraceae bacterium]